MAKNPAFPFYAQDFLVDSYQWNRSHKGLHVELLSIAWINGFIEADENGKPVGIDAEGLGLWNERVGFKWVYKNGKLFNERLECERAKKEKFLEKQVENGKKGGRKPNSYPNETQPFTQTETKRKPLEKEKEKELEKEIEIEKEKENFAIFQNPNNVDGLGMKFIIPQMCDTWYEKFPLYTKDRKKDFHAMQSILQFMADQAEEDDIGSNQEHFLKVIETLKALSELVSRETFWINKPLTSIANNIQEFYNKIKNPQHDQRNSFNAKKGTNNLRAEVQAEFDKRFATVQ